MTQHSQLCYRGVSYAAPTNLIVTKPTHNDYTGVYRGAVWHAPYQLTIEPHPTVILKYRGAFYTSPGYMPAGALPQVRHDINHSLGVSLPHCPPS